MIEQLCVTVLILFFTLPIGFLLKRKNGFKKTNLVRLSVYHIIYVALIFLPVAYSSLAIPESRMNWSGKVAGIIFSAIVYVLYKNKDFFHDYIVGPTPVKFPRKSLIAGAVTLVSMCALTFLFSKNKEPDIERLIYQLSIPGMDEELWRGILLGFLLLQVKDIKYPLGNPALWITTLIFALGHSLYLQNWEIGFIPDAFIVTGVLGYILGWMTLTSGNILPAVVFHNLINFSTNFIEMYLL